MKPENPNIKMAYERKMTLGFTGVAEFSTNPFPNHISTRSPQKDQLVLKSVEGKVIGNYEIEKYPSDQPHLFLATFNSELCQKKYGIKARNVFRSKRMEIKWTM